MGIASAVSSGLAVDATAFGTVTAPPDAPIEVQLDAFRRAIESIYSRMDHFERQSLSRDSALEASLDALTSEVREGISTLTRRLDDEASAAARPDARGLGPVAFGFVMVAVPDHLASVSLFGASFTDAALIVTAATALAVFPGVLRSSAP